MFSYIEIAFAWMLFISMLVIAVGMFYRAAKHYSAWKQMQSASRLECGPDENTRLQLYSAVTNISCATALCLVVASILLFGLAFASWSGIAAMIIWGYYLMTSLLERRRLRASSF